jgi:gliding motility-associated-like protein
MKTLFIALCFLFNYAFANNKIALQNAEKMMQKSSWAFEENKGQVTGADANNVKFVYKDGSLSMFLMQAGIAYQFHKVTYPEGYKALDKFASIEEQEKMEKLQGQIKTETYRMDVILEGANPNPKIKTEGKSEDYIQYYNHNALDVRSYQKVTYCEVYPNIDWVVYLNKNAGINEPKVKYDFIVHPGGDPSQIKLKTAWVEELTSNADGSITLNNRMGSITEQRPISFQEDKAVSTNFVVKNNIINFLLSNYDINKDIVIDPGVVWATYYGGSVTDIGNSCAVDSSGNVYLAGQTASTNNIALGGHQNTIGGNDDAFLVKFNSAGVRQWATYYGGTTADRGNSCAVDSSGNVYLAGYTASINNIASGGHQNTFGGNNDAFLVKFNSAGVRQWATYYGGTVTDIGNSCAVDSSGNVYLTGQTTSTNNIASGGHQNTISVSGYNAFLVKFNNAGVRQWATYYGGNSGGVGNSCAVDNNGNVYLAGVTQSTNNIASGGHQNIISGSVDAFLVKFNSAGVRQWATYYGGSGVDFGRSCAVDGSGNVYLAGQTASTNNIASGGHQNTFGGGWDAFLVKFNSAGVRQWATYYGGTVNDDGRSCGVDGSGNVYLAGGTTSTNNIASGGHQNTFGGGWDAFLVKFNSAGVRQWATYYGGTVNDDGRSCAVDGSGNLYLAGQTFSSNNIASGGHQNTINGSWDAYLVKFNNLLNLITQDTIKACGDSVLVSATSGMNTYNWSNGKTTASIFAKSTGWYKVTATNSAGNAVTDSVFVSIVKANILNIDTAICLGRSVRLRADTISLNYTTGITCLEIQENNSGILQGPLGSIISNINFASYGTPTGSCNSYNISSCSAANSFSIVSNLCIGNNLCNLSATNSVFGDPCGGIYKRLYVSATYQIKSDKYLWSTGDTTPTINVTPTVTTKYWVRVSNGSHFCSDTFTVTVNTNTLSTINQTICQGQSLLGRTVSGVYIDTLIGANNKGCDSIRTLILTVIDTTKKDSFRTICQYQPIIFNGQTINTSGVYRDTLVNARGCDSFLVLNLTVNDTSRKDSFRTICYNQTILFNGQTLNSSGSYRDTLTNAKGCDSFLVLHLTVSDCLILNFLDTQAYCKGDKNISTSLRIQGRPTAIITSAKVYFENYVAAEDTLLITTLSPVTTSFDAITGVLTLSGSATVERYDTILRTIQYRKKKQSFTTSTKKVRITLGNALHNPFNNHYYQLVNHGSPIAWTAARDAAAASTYFGLQGYLVTITESNENNFIKSLINSNVWMGASDAHTERTWRWVTGCEGLESGGLGRKFGDQTGGCPGTGGFTNLGANYSNWAGAEPNETACNEDYGHLYANGTWNDFPNTNGVSTYIIEYGCMPNDPVVQLTGQVLLNIKPMDTLTVSHTMCQGSVFLGKSITGIYLDTFNNRFGCDSIRRLQLIVNDSSRKDSFRTICKNQSLIFNGNALNTSGTYRDTLVNARGCDSFLYLILTVNDTSRKDSFRTICKNQSLVFNGNTLNTSGTYRDTFINSRGCDSFLVLHLTVNDTTRKDSFRTICRYQPIIFNGQILNTSGVYRDTLVNTKGCDSFLYLILTVNDTSQKDSFRTICRYQPIIFNGQTLNTSGVYRDTLVNTKGCDSFLYLILTVNDTSQKDSFRTICKNQPIVFNGQTLNTSGVYRDTLVNATGCDSFLVLNLTVNDTTRKDSFRTICKNQFVVFNGVSLNTSGVYRDTFVNSKGCDSFLYLILTVNDTTRKDSFRTICKNQFVVFNGVGLNTSGVYRDTFVNSKGCDSFLYLILTVNDTTRKDSFRTICKNQFVVFNGVSLNTTGVYRDSFVNSKGCDSFLYLILTVNDTTRKDSFRTICRYQPITFNGQTLNTSGVYRDSFVNSKGCDSFLYLILTVNDTTRKDSFRTICKNQPLVFNGQTLNSSGVYRDTLVNAKGCDSFVYLWLRVEDTVRDTIRTIRCYGEIYRSYSNPGIYQEFLKTTTGCDSVLTIILDYLPPKREERFVNPVCGSYTYQSKIYTKTDSFLEIIRNRLGCDSVVLEKVYVIKPKAFVHPVKLIPFCEEIIYFGSTRRSSFEVRDTIRTQGAPHCDSIYQSSYYQRFAKPKMQITLQTNDSVVRGENVILVASGASQYMWSTGLKNADLTLKLEDEITTITLRGWSTPGCQDSTSIQVYTIEQPVLDVPMAFSPNNDQKNDYFVPNTKGFVTITAFDVYNRWGEKLYSHTPYSLGWDGSYKNAPAQVGVYSYYIEYEYLRRKFIKTGEFQLLR